MPGFSYDGDSGGLKGADGTPIGNVNDRLKVDALLSVNLPGFSGAGLLNLGFGAAVTSPTWPAVKPLSYYVVPAGRTFRLLGVSYKTSTPTTYVTVYQRKVLWKFAVATANPTAPTLTAKTISGSGLTLLATYRYKIVGVNHVGKTTGSTETVVTLTGTQNAATLSWAAVVGVSYYEIHRTGANGATNTQALIGLSEGVTYTDVSPDSDLDLAQTPPASNTTAGSVDALSYTAGIAGTTVVVDTLTAITTPTPLDIIYKNIYGSRSYLTATPGAAVGAQVELGLAGKTNPAANSRIARTGARQFIDVSMADIVSVGNTPATGGFLIYGVTPIITSSGQTGNRWETFLLENALTFAAGEELVFGVSSNVAVTAASRQDVNLLGILE